MGECPEGEDRQRGRTGGGIGRAKDEAGSEGLRLPREIPVERKDEGVYTSSLEDTAAEFGRSGRGEGDVQGLRDPNAVGYRAAGGSAGGGGREGRGRRGRG